MTAVSEDRWTCPVCEDTTVSEQKNPRNVRRELQAAQLRHGQRHRRELSGQLRSVAR